MGAVDLVIAAVVLAGALWVVVRSFRRGGSHCGGCAGGACQRPPNAVTIGAHRAGAAEERSPRQDCRG